MIRDQYVVRLAVVRRTGSKVSVLELDDWQQAALERLAAEVLTDRQLAGPRRRVLRALTDDLHREAEQHL